MSRLISTGVAALLVSVQGWDYSEAFAAASEEKGQPAESAPRPLPADQYYVSPRDILQITIVGETDLPTTFEVSQRDGTIKYPFIGYVKVAGLTVQEIEKLLTQLLQDGWFVKPQVNVRVDQYSEKLFYVEGFVSKPGEYSFTGQNVMTVYRAIIRAGGFARYAKKKVIVITTDEKGKEKRLDVDVDDIIKKKAVDPVVRANDIIHVPERIF